MAMDPTTFRMVYRGFADAGNYPDALLTYWENVAVGFLAGSSSFGANRWGAQLDYATGLFMAHNLTLAVRDVATLQAGGIPGEVKGPATAKAVDKVSASYDTKAVTFEDEPFWNQTAYGIALVNLFKMFGAGGVQIDACPVFDATPWGLYLPPGQL